MGLLRVTVLTWADALAGCLIWMIMPYLLDVWKLNFTHAAGILNIWCGLSFILVLVMAFLVDSFLGEYLILLISSIAFCIGLGFLAMSTPPGKGKCHEYRPECLTDTQKTLFYAALALISVGISGHQASLFRFLLRQTLQMGDMINASVVRMALYGLCSCGISYVPIAGIIALFLIKPWSIRFGMPAICSLVATLLFITGSCSYSHGRLPGSPLTTTFRVLAASMSKMFLPSPSNPVHELYERPQLRVQVPRSQGLRFLEKAAIIKPNKTIDEQRTNRWTLCRVTEVEETKAIFRMIPIWIISLLYGVVSSLGNTFFLAQANTMNSKLGKANVPLLIFLLISGWSTQFFAWVHVSLVGCFVSGRRSRKFFSTIGIAISLILAVLCCITAAKVESQRLNAVISNGLLDKPDAKVPMSMFRLVPQYILLGATNAVYSISISVFITQFSPFSMTGYIAQVNHGINGLGVICSVFLVFGGIEFSQRGEKMSWFQESLNKSRLDNYYWSLAALCAINLFVYVLVAIWYHCGRSGNDDDDDGDDLALLTMDALFAQFIDDHDDV